ncbi:hypothetical protein M8C21_018493 [Ambrosia artemisiifolia]|uniref:C-CAP/cofactor C-like domain-containing protein n=1 Tax=Ambrosia artemisiifolia TaxID=4212 RepID=A0AAD5CJH4_AMBAR|nr:hypothetical protein M8C21_018493 [Ambrosia artemisiifolia]
MTSPPPPEPQPPPPLYIHPRREPFEHGLIPLPNLISTDPTQSLTSLRTTLLNHPLISNHHRVSPTLLSQTLQISLQHAHLVLQTISSVHPSVSDPLVTAKHHDIDSVGVNVYDLIVFLYIQSYKRLGIVPKGHKDSPAIADVWPSTSAFDGFLSALTPLQLARGNVRRSMPSQADEEAHQLSYLQKHLGNIISLLAEPVEGQAEDDSLVLTMENFEHLSFLFYFGDKGSENIPLSQNAPFFANSDPDMPAAPVPATQVHDWIEENINSALQRISERVAAKENGSGPTNASDHDVLGAVGKAVRIEHCERVHVITVAKRICIANCRECVFFLGVNQQPLLVGDNHKLQVAPYNTFYPQLEEHMKQVGVEVSPNKWDEPIALGLVDPHDSISHPAGVSDCQTESATHLEPDQFTNFLIPNWFQDEGCGSTKDNPFPLPDLYMSSQQKNDKNLVEVKQILKETQLEDNKKRELSTALHAYFKDWLYASGNVRQLYCLQGE